MPKSKCRLLLVLGDTHIGSTYGLFPPGFVTFEGNEVKQNALQKWLWKGWSYAIDEWLPKMRANDPFVFVHMGDVIEGLHHGTKEVISPDMQDHFEAARLCLAPTEDESVEIGVNSLARLATKTFIVEGTAAHGENTESSLGKMIGAQPDNGSGRYSFGRLSLDIAGTRVVGFHHISTTSRTWLEGSAPSIYLAQEQLDAARSGEVVPKVLLCGHRHKHGHFQNEDGLCIVSPAWQAKTRYGRRVAPTSRFRTGMTLLDWREKRDGQIPEVHSIVFETPLEPTVSV